MTDRSEASENPPTETTVLDILEEVMDERGWPLERNSEIQVSTLVEIENFECTLSLQWSETRAELFFSSWAQILVPYKKHKPVCQLLNRINESVPEGCFFVTQGEGFVVRKSTISFRGSFESYEIAKAYLVERIETGLGEWHHIHDSLNMVIHGGMDPEQAYTASLIETKGEA